MLTDSDFGSTHDDYSIYHASRSGARARKGTVMKCPQCDATQKYSAGMQCLSCRYRWVFSPKKDPLPDKKWLAAITRVTGNDTYYFTDNQLYAECCRRARKSCWLGYLVGGGGVIVALVLSQTVQDGMPWVALVPLVVAAWILYWSWLCRHRLPLSVDVFNGLIKRWQADGIAGSLDKRITRPALDKAPPVWREPDMYDYGFQHLLIVERDLLVDLLVLNQFHANNQTLIVAESGYPSYLVSLAVKALDERPEMPVFLMHDATAAGRLMAARVSRSTLYPLVGRKTIDIGLHAEDVKRLKGLRRANAAAIPTGAPLDLLLTATLCAGAALALETQQPLASFIGPATMRSTEGGVSASFG